MSKWRDVDLSPEDDISRKILQAKTAEVMRMVEEMVMSMLNDGYTDICWGTDSDEGVLKITVRGKPKRGRGMPGISSDRG